MHSEDTAKVINHRHGHCWRGTARATHSRRHRGGRPGCDRGRDLLVLIGAPADGQKVLLAVIAMGGEAWRAVGPHVTMITGWRCPSICCACCTMASISRTNLALANHSRAFGLTREVQAHHDGKR